MSWLKVLVWLLRRRFRSSWALLAITSFGVLAAVTLLAVGVIYTRALAEGGLRHALGTRSPVTNNSYLLVQNRPLGLADYERLRATVDDVTDQSLGHILQGSARFGRTQPDLLLVTRPEGDPAGSDAPLGRPFFLTGFEEHSRLIDGRWPQAAPVIDDGELVIETVLGGPVSHTTMSGAGSVIYLFPFPGDPSQRVTLKVVGVAEPIDPREAYWMGTPSALFNPQEYADAGKYLFPMYVSEDTFFSGLASYYPLLVGDYAWHLFMDTGALTPSDVGATRAAIDGLEVELNKSYPRSLVLTSLGNALGDFQKELTRARVPIFVFLSLVVVVMLYFLAMVVGLLSRTRSDESGLLKSRGSSTLQVTGFLVLAEGMMVLIAIVVGPFLALAIVRFLLLGTIDPGGDLDPVSIGLSWDTFGVAAIGGVLSLGILGASGVGMARLGLVESLRVRARPPAVPILQRYYIDVLVLAAVGLLWWQIEDKDGFIGRDVTTKAIEVDPSLLLGPVLVLLGVAFLLLRVLPLILRLLAWAASLVAPAWATFTLTRVARDPLPHGSLAIMLMMAAALGIFGASFQPSLSRSQEEQVLYDVGGDVVVEASALPTSTVEDLSKVPGVRSLSPVERYSLPVIGQASASIATVMAVDPETLHEAAWFRNDFSGLELDDLLAPLRETGGEPRALTLRPDADRAGVWVNVEDVGRRPLQDQMNFWMRVFDDDGNYRNLPLGDLQLSDFGQDSWIYLEAELPVDSRFPEDTSFGVGSIFFSRRSVTGMGEGSISLDDITVKGPFAPDLGVVVEGFERPGAWVPFPSSQQLSDTLDHTPRAARTGRFGISLKWRRTAGNSSVGALLPPGPFPLPAVGGPTFRVGDEFRVRSGRQMVPIVIKDVTDYFPTVDPSRQPFLLVSSEDYRAYMKRSGGDLGLSGELWVSLDDGVDRDQTLLSLEGPLPGFASVRDRDAEVDLTQRNPLGGGGWNGLTLIAIVALTLAAVLALGAYAAVSMRTGRVDLSLARALGLSTRQIVLSMALERFVIALLGIGIGTVVGAWLGRWVLGYLDATSSGAELLPPMIVTFEGWLVGVVYLVLVAALVFTTLLAAVWAGRLPVPEVLRGD